MFISFRKKTQVVAPSALDVATETVKAGFPATLLVTRAWGPGFLTYHQPHPLVIQTLQDARVAFATTEGNAEFLNPDDHAREGALLLIYESSLETPASLAQSLRYAVMGLAASAIISQEGNGPAAIVTQHM